MVPVGGELIRNRKHAMFNGIVVASIAVDEDGELLVDPVLTTSGLLEADESHLLAAGREMIEDVLDRLSSQDRRSDRNVREAVRVALRRFFKNTLDKKPATDIHVLRIPFDDDFTD